MLLDFGAEAADPAPASLPQSGPEVVLAIGPVIKTEMETGMRLFICGVALAALRPKRGKEASLLPHRHSDDGDPVGLCRLAAGWVAHRNL